MDSCGRGGKCEDAWTGRRCLCPGFASQLGSCEKEERVSLAGGHLRYDIRPHFRRTLLTQPIIGIEFFPVNGLAMQSSHAEEAGGVRESDDHKLQLHFRTIKAEGLLFFASSETDFSLIDVHHPSFFVGKLNKEVWWQLWNGTIRYVSRVGGAAATRILLNTPPRPFHDGAWHRLTFALRRGGMEAQLRSGHLSCHLQEPR